MRVLIACEFSGRVRDAFKKLGHDAWSCDLEPTEVPGQHYHGPVEDILGDGWDLMIAHPPCTYLCNSGGIWLDKKEGRWEALDEGARFFRMLLESPIPRIAIENPIPHGHALQRIGRKYDQIIQPWQHGHVEKKGTCLWLKNLPLLRPTLIVPKEGRFSLTSFEDPGPNRWKARARTYTGIAKAMAEQWSRIP